MANSGQWREKGITPLLMDAIKLQGHAFRYLYPSPAVIGCRDQFAYLEKRNLGKDLIPWMFSVIFVSRIIGLGTIVTFLPIILLSSKDELPPWVEWNPFQAALLLVVGLGIIIQLVVYLAMFAIPETVTALTGIQLIESECKIQIN